MQNNLFHSLEVENVTPHSEKEMIKFLIQFEDTCMFMLGNFEVHGSKLTDAPNSGNFKLIRKSKDLVGVFCLTRRGTILVQSTIVEPTFELILKHCQDEKIPIKGVAGDWEYCSLFWNFIKKRQVIYQDSFSSKEILYTLDLVEKSYQKIENIRVLHPQDFLEWEKLNKEYLVEQELPSGLSDEQLKADFTLKASQRIIWGLFLDGKLTTVAELNAKALDLGQVGGVYTSPNYRKKGFATLLMQQIIMDIKQLHGIRKLIIFTDENNHPAKKVYESLGAKHVGYFALLFGE